MTPAALQKTTYLRDLAEFMHGHRKKTLFFIERLCRYAENAGLEPRLVKVLELGCGNGRVVTLPVAEQGFDVLGVDSHAPSIEAARAHNTLDNARFECVDFRDAPRTNDFHAVILSDVLEHIDDPGLMLEVAAGALRPDGVMLISIPNGFGPYEIEQFLIRKGVLRLPLVLVRRGVQGAVRVKQALHGAPPPDPEQPAYNVDSPHVQHLTLGRFRHLLRTRGFRIERRRNGAWFGGDLTYFIFYFVPPLVRLSLRAADLLPAQLVSTWYFECRREDASRVPVS